MTFDRLAGRLERGPAAIGLALGLAMGLAVAGALAFGPADAQTVADPVARAKDEIERTCLQVEYREDFASWADVTGDGLDDVVIKYSVSCDGYHSMFCGQDGCSGGVFVARPDGGFMETGLPPEVETTTWNGWPALEVLSHGSNCGRVGPNACRQLRVWDGDGFVRPTDELARRAPPEERTTTRVDAAPELPKPFSGVAVEPVYSAPEAEPQEPAPEREVASLENGVVNDGAPDEPAVDEDPELAQAPAEPLQPASAEAWVYNEGAAGLNYVEILGQDGEAALRLSCVEGDRTLALSFRPGGLSSDRLRRAAGVLLLVDFTIGRRVSESRLLAYAPSRSAWDDNISPDGRLITDMRRFSWLSVREPGGDEILGEFALRGSSRAIAEMMGACRI